MALKQPILGIKSAGSPINTGVSSFAIHSEKATHVNPAYTGSTGLQIGYLASMQDPSGVTTYQRDSSGRVLAKTQTVNDNPAARSSHTTAYTYSTGPNKGELASITYPSGLKAIYNRSASGQITGISTQVPGLNKPVVPFVSGISYTALNQPKAWTWASGDAAARTFDADGRMTSNELASYTFDAASRVSGITQQLWASRTVTQVIGTATTVVTQLYQTPLSWTAGYDNRNRLTGFNRPGSASGFSYDANSNRLSAIDQTISDTNASGGFELADTALTTNQTLALQSGSNRLLGFAQTLTRVQGTRTLATTNSTVNYALDANGNLTSDGLRSFEYDAANRLSKVRILKDGEAASIKYLTNAQGQQVFKSEPKPDQYLPSQSELGVGFIAWLKTNFGWLYAQAQTDASLGSAYMYADGQLPSWVVLGEYDNGSASGTGRTEYIWLPLEDGGAVPVGMFRNSKFFAIHSDHLGTPRLMTDSLNKPVWQWPYSAFGNNKPTGVLKPTTSATGAFTNQPNLLATQNPAVVLDLRFPGQMADVETGLFYNYFRSYQPNQGRYTQADPIGMGGGWNRFGYANQNALSYTDPTGQLAFAIPFIPAIITGADLAIGAGLGILGYGLDRMFAKPPQNAYDPNGPKAPGKPTEADGFKSPKGGDNWVPNPNPGKGGSGYGWEDAKGDVWCPTGPAGPGTRAHGGPHWDVQSPGGGYRNKRPQQ